MFDFKSAYANLPQGLEEMEAADPDVIAPLFQEIENEFAKWVDTHTNDLIKENTSILYATAGGAAFLLRNQIQQNKDGAEALAKLLTDIDTLAGESIKSVCFTWSSDHADYQAENTTLVVDLLNDKHCRMAGRNANREPFEESGSFEEMWQKFTTPRT